MQDNILMGEFERENIQERVGKLKGGLCIIKSGGLSEVEAKENRDRIEDALFAVKAALEEGYVVGGGFALIQACKELKPDSSSSIMERTGFELVIKAC